MKNIGNKAFRYVWMASIALVFAMLSFGVASAQVSGQSSSVASTPLSLTNLYVSPSPVVAGSTENITFQLFNSYSQPLQDVNIQLVSPNQILNISPAFSSLESSIGTGLVGAIGYDEFSYTVHIPSTLQAGEYTLYVIATYRTSEASATGQNIETPGESEIPIYFYIYGKPSIEATAVPTSQIVPGNPFGLSISLSNVGTDTATNATLRLYNTSGFEITGTPEFAIGTIPVGTPITVSEPMFAMQNLSSGVHYINASINYTNGLGQRLRENITMPISVAVNNPDIIVSLAGAMPPELYAGSNQSLDVLVQNTGTGEARNISLEFMNGKSINIGSSVNSFLINSLPAGASATEEVYVNSYSDNISNAAIPVKVSYENSDMAKTFSSTQQMNLNLQPSALFNITAMQSSSLSIGATYVPIIYTIKNTGNEPATGLELTMESVYPITVVSSTSYINNLGAGQSANVTFYVSVDSDGKSGNYPVTMYEQWKQPNSPQSQEFTGSTQYYAVVGSHQSSDAALYDIIYAVIAVIIIAVLIRVVRKRQASTHKEDKPSQKRKA